MKTEQEVREAIEVNGISKDAWQYANMSTNVLTKEQIQDLAVIIGKALGVVE